MRAVATAPSPCRLPAISANLRFHRSSLIIAWFVCSWLCFDVQSDSYNLFECEVDQQQTTPGTVVCYTVRVPYRSRSSSLRALFDDSFCPV